jgi:putative ABC transport system permease protein
VGISTDPDDCVECLRAAVAPATFDEALSGTWSQDGRFARVLVSAPPDMDQAEFAERIVQVDDLQGIGVSGPAADLLYTDIDERAWTRVWATVGVVFLLVWTGLIAATGLAVGARRRRRELGLLAANGADPRQLRLAVVAEGLLAGAVGAVGGALVGVGGSLVLLRWLEGVREGPLLNRVDPLGVAVWVAVLIVCGLLAAVLAARAAATGLGRATPNELLRGARRAPRPAPQWFAAGVVAIVAGLVMAGVVANSDGSDGNLLGLMVTVSLGLLTAGLVAMVVGASRVLPRLTAPLPLPARLAGRDLQRHGMRVGASCGAVALTLTAAVASATLFESQRVELDERPRTAIVELPAGTEYLTVEGSRSELVGDQVVDRAYGTEVVADLRAGGFTAGGTRTFGPPDGLRTCWGEPGGDAVQECQPAMVTVLDDTLSSRLRPELRRALEQQLPVVAPSLQLRRSDDTPVEHADLLEVLDPAPGTPGGALMYERAFQSDVLVTEDGARALGVDLDRPELTGSAMVLHDGSDDRIIDRVQDVVGDDLAVVSSFSSTDPLPLGWVVAGGMGFVTIVTLLVVLFALALMRVESRADDAVLAVVGASPAVARRTQAMRGGLMVLMAAVPATAVGWALVRVVSDGQVWPVVTPWWAVGIVVVALPVLTALLSGLSDRPGRRLKLG